MMILASILIAVASIAISGVTIALNVKMLHDRGLDWLGRPRA